MLHIGALLAIRPNLSDFWVIISGKLNAVNRKIVTYLFKKIVPCVRLKLGTCFDAEQYAICEFLIVNHSRV